MIAATNRDLREMIRAGEFREDLYYRLNVVEIELPPLKDREGDVAILAQHFLADMAPGRSLSPQALQILSRYPWPGNVRELRNVIERMSILAEGKELGVDDVPGDVQAGAEDSRPISDPHSTTPADGTRPSSLADLERHHIEQVLEFTGGNKAKAARILGITAATLYNKLKAYKAQDASGDDDADA